MKKINIWIIVLILLANQVLSLGIAPVKNSVDFEPGLTKDFTLTILNNEEKDFKALITVEGDLKEYVVLDEKEIIISKDEKRKTFAYQLKLPATFEKPGIHDAEIVVFEKSLDDDEQGNTIKAMAAVGSKIFVRVLHKGTYAEAKLFIDSKELTASFILPMVNHGDQDIEKASAKIQILDEDNNVISEVNSNEVKVPAGKEAKLKASWSGEPGNYHAKAIIDYGKQIILEKDFTLGGNLLDVVRIGVRDFILGDIAKFDIYLENKLTKEMDDVYGEVTILDDKGAEQTSFRTVPVEIPPKDIGKIEAYWDTKEVSVGKYYMNLLIHYMDKVTEKMVELQVNLDSIQTNFAPTGEVVALGSASGNKPLIIVITVISVLVNIFLFVYIFKIRKKK